MTSIASTFDIKAHIQRVSSYACTSAMGLAYCRLELVPTSIACHVHLYVVRLLYTCMKIPNSPWV